MHRDATHLLALYTPRLIFGVSNKLEWQPGVEEVWTSLLDARWR